MKEDRIAVNNQINIKDDNNIMSTNSVSSDRTSNVARFTVAASAGHRLPICKTLLWLALPLTLAVGCASCPDRTTVAGDFPPPAIQQFPSHFAQ
jgi:hypothetical protein